MAQTRDAKILILNGPNLNLLGTREVATYGSTTLAEIEALCLETAAAHNLAADFRQTNSEGTLVDWIQSAKGDADVIILNAAAYTHTSVAIRDAIGAVALPVIEVHLSNIFAREAFRHHSHVSPVAVGVICGFGADGYRLAIDAAAALLKRRAQA